MLDGPEKQIRAATSALVRQLGLEAIGEFHRQRGLCLHCGQPWGRGGEIDHHIPVSLGGDASIQNLRVLCHGCNAKKGNRHPEDRSVLLPPPVVKMSLRDISREVVFKDQSGGCFFCPQPLIGNWSKTRRCRGVCQSCTVLYRGLSEEQIIRKLGLDLI